MPLADAPDYITAIMAGLAHGLTPPKALHGAWGKWMADNAESIQEFGLANFYNGPEESRAMVNYTRLTQYLAIMVAEQGRRNAHLEDCLRSLVEANPTLQGREEALALLG